MTAVAIKMYTQEEYLELERAAEYKSEYYRGEIFAMSGARFNHNRIKENTALEIGLFLKGKPCSSLSSDMRVHIPENTLYTYPDILIVCGEPEFQDDHMDTLLNASVIIEVLSPSTSSYDQGKKFSLYQSLKSLREYILIDSQEIGARVFRKNDEGAWLISSIAYDINSSIEIGHIGLTLKMSTIYEQTIDLL
ncbi:Uma2 family endonuclease [Dyadobacter jiangsuensis]|uniref:Uma2 family endonuclease n=1 Tax=Dyadobacter fermentans TaxID=94254 RepID=UPI001CC098F8|nr:Uma2 family endonuclease [Dyadobacter fermentans]MBZ1359063.1 Uma2 family endonuclease [Dyadobacter fermentans]